ncbi:1-deoxy-D-xylulose-5-phosphate reductoisomerase [Moraxella nasovis]|uniref:1-deoxy-D-xylulose-5-phosphate reductoisomerase n=1 Tax=Moraxella nasovis TaxID=2904121 RepID=UPI001F61B2E9|nr:1-deoxy-D-xylulose-5-phosphate reductoisomerase [Moraxella nasovis]UNU73582.1 1-deoxy-D-xylulose-5-phosphate reductoisomerase [Moraxella nasovis]
MQNITLLGATGSIGDSTLDIIRRHSDRYQIYALSGFRQLTKLFALCQEFSPKRVCVAQDDVDAFADKIRRAGLATEVVGGQDGLCDLAKDSHSQTVVGAIVGSAGLPSILQAVKSGKKVLLANKESLVMAGDLVMNAARHSGATILPIDSEHNAIFQCLPKAVQEDNHAIHNVGFGIKRLWLTASGGSFLHKSYDEMKKASVSDAIKHPNWSMGQKISVDSSTMMNKGLELIEACHLFNLSQDKIDIVIHPQSIVHSMVEYIDGSFLAQCGTPDMKTPIAHALAYPDRIDSGVSSLDLFKMADLQFIRPDELKFKSLSLARYAVSCGNGATIALNAANEIAVDAFLGGKIALTDIADVVEKVLHCDDLSKDFGVSFTDLTDILTFDQAVRLASNRLIGAL